MITRTAATPHMEPGLGISSRFAEKMVLKYFAYTLPVFITGTKNCSEVIQRHQNIILEICICDVSKDCPYKEVLFQYINL